MNVVLRREYQRKHLRGHLKVVLPAIDAYFVGSRGND